MTELEIKIIKFLLSAAVYSETAIMKNLGIDEKTLKKSFITLEKNGYLEPYSDFIKRESLNEENNCCKSKANKSCSSCSASKYCSSSNCCSNNIFSNIEDFSKIKVLTNKAVDEFY
ncbi:hypothetical protein [Fusobacterium russii]|uniref:hypothetical protein n=1 Tax=Fusobacterium russii TaxID=854 RepID=UPI0003A1DB42|nr:hypothetical protein [Fusobacterium russii]